MAARSRLILAIVIGLVVCVAVYFLLVRSKQGELNDVNDQIAAAEVQTQALQAELQRLRDLQKRAPELQAELDRFRALVPSNHEIANFIVQVQDAADQSGVKFRDITPELPKSPPEGAPLAEVRMTMGASGGYYALQDFIRRLSELDRAVRIDTLTMSGGETTTGGTEITLSMTARVFFELPGAAGVATDAPPNTPIPVPDSTATPAPTTTP